MDPPRTKAIGLIGDVFGPLAVGCGCGLLMIGAFAGAWHASAAVARLGDIDHRIERLESRTSEGRSTMPTDDERREYPHVTESEWAGVEAMRRRKAAGEFPFEPREHTPTIEELILEQLERQTALLREIRDRLAKER